MTHSLHREGEIESLENDFVILITPAIGFNDRGSGEKLKKCLHILMQEGVTNIGDVEHGSQMGNLDPKTLESYLKDGKRIRACISSKDNLKDILKRLKNEDIGLSVTVSGLTDSIYEVSKELGIKPHTINLSLGVYGKLETLPSNEVLEITTMCGHHMVSRHLVEDMIQKIKHGTMSPEMASLKIGKLCVCGIFNPNRCIEILQRIQS